SASASTSSSVPNSNVLPLRAASIRKCCSIPFGRVVVRDGLINAVLDDKPSDVTACHFALVIIIHGLGKSQVTEEFPRWQRRWRTGRPIPLAPHRGRREPR